MKRFFTFIMLMWLGLAFAQNSDGVTYYAKMKSVTSELDSSKFKNKILYNRVFPWAGLQVFNKKKRNDQ